MCSRPSGSGRNAAAADSLPSGGPSRGVAGSPENSSRRLPCLRVMMRCDSRNAGAQSRRPGLKGLKG